MKLDVHMFGPYPPPYGGVSMHIHRLRNRLIEDGHACTVWSRHNDPTNNFFVLPKGNGACHSFEKISAKAILHFHGNHRLAGRLAAIGRNVLFTVHNERINLTLDGSGTIRQQLSKHLSRRAFKHVDSLIAVSNKAKGELVKFGFQEEQIKVLTAYLKPGGNERPSKTGMSRFKAFRKRHLFLMIVCAKAQKPHCGEDLYGLDMCIDLMSRLTNRIPETGLVLAIPDGKGTEYWSSLHEQAERLGLSDHILWLHEPGALHPLMKQCDTFLRPTNTDGFSISVAEAMEFDIPVVASDAAERPEGCLLFNNRNLDDLVRRAVFVLENIKEQKQRAQKFRVEDQYDRIVKLYQSLV